MPTIAHIIDVGQGNMVLIEASSGRNFVFDCNVTEENKDRVLDYVGKEIGEGNQLHAFICSHRDADHIRGIKKLHKRFPIREIWDSNYPGTTTDTIEYRAYMDLRRQVGNKVIKKRQKQDFGRTRFRYMSAQDIRLPDNANAQGVVIKVEHRSANADRSLSSVMLPGDSDAETWRYGIMDDYYKSDVSSTILMGAHHGSISFFDDPGDETNYYTTHMQNISPDMTIISVGPNRHGHPSDAAIRLYRKYSSGSDMGNKVYRTDTQGTIKLTLKDGGGCNISKNQ